ncbi:unnamed protein product [Ectocarpus sp. 13 AM-2016]
MTFAFQSVPFSSAPLCLPLYNHPRYLFILETDAWAFVERLQRPGPSEYPPIDIFTSLFVTYYLPVDPQLSSFCSISFSLHTLLHQPHSLHTHQPIFGGFCG